MATRKVLFHSNQRDIPDCAARRIDACQNRVDNGLFVHYPANDDVIISGTVYELVKQKTNIMERHRLCFLCWHIHLVTYA